MVRFRRRLGIETRLTANYLGFLLSLLDETRTRSVEDRNPYPAACSLVLSQRAKLRHEL